MWRDQREWQKRDTGMAEPHMSRSPGPQHISAPFTGKKKKKGQIKGRARQELLQNNSRRIKTRTEVVGYQVGRQEAGNKSALTSSDS